MHRIYWFFLLLTFLLFCSGSDSFAQREGYNKGFQLATLASFDQYYLFQQTENGPNFQYRSEDRFPNDYNFGYQVGLINRKKFWHQTNLNFTYFPEFSRNYTEYKVDDQDWKTIPHTVNFSMEMYRLDLAKTFKINLFDHKLYATLGFGASGGIVRWPDALEDGDLFFFAGQLWPSAGLELKLLSWLGVFGEMRYHYGTSETITQINQGQSTQWQYGFEGQELKLGVNFYYTK